MTRLPFYLDKIIQLKLIFPYYNERIKNELYNEIIVEIF